MLINEQLFIIQDFYFDKILYIRSYISVYIKKKIKNKLFKTPK